MANLAGLDSRVRSRIEAAIAAAGRERIRVTVTSTRRDPKKQKQLYDAWIARGRTGLPAAPPGSSTHEYGLGIDLVVSPAGSLQRFAKLAACQGLVWAGKADPVHFDPFGFAVWRAMLRGEVVPKVVYQC